MKYTYAGVRDGSSVEVRASSLGKLQLLVDGEKVASGSTGFLSGGADLVDNSRGWTVRFTRAMSRTKKVILLAGGDEQYLPLVKRKM